MRIAPLEHRPSGARAGRSLVYLFGALAGVLSCAPSLALADSAIVLVADTAVSRGELERARAAAIEVLAERGVRLVRVPDGPVCEEVACAAELAERAGVEMVVLVRAEEGRARVWIVAPSGRPREASARVGEAGLGAATSAALEEALETGADARSGFLLVRTRPPGARLTIDGVPAGETPLRRMVRVGEHHVRITPASGGAAIERRVDVRPLEETSLELDLAATDEPSEAGGSSAPARTRPSDFNWIIGGALAIGGVVALISPLQTLATHGQCVDLIENVGCVERVELGAQSGILLGLGVAALVAAVVVDVVAPIRVAVEASPTRAGLWVEGRF